MPYRVLGESKEIFALCDTWTTVCIGMTLVQIHVTLVFNICPNNFGKKWSFLIGILQSLAYQCYMNLEEHKCYD